MKTDDELIAEFMGGVKRVVGEDKLHGYAPGTTLWYGLFDDSGPTTYLCFEDDWEWLMPVVAKIAEYRLVYPEQTERVCGLRIVVNRDVLHERVVEFIKWYNETKP